MTHQPPDRASLVKTTRTHIPPDQEPVDPEAFASLKARVEEMEAHAEEMDTFLDRNFANYQEGMREIQVDRALDQITDEGQPQDG